MSDFTLAVAEILDATEFDALTRAAQAVMRLRSAASEDEVADAVLTISGELDPEYAEMSGLLAITADGTRHGTFRRFVRRSLSRRS